MALSAPLLSACAHNPAIEREQFILVSDTELAAMGAQTRTQVEATPPVSRNTALIQLVERVGRHILRENAGLLENAGSSDTSRNALQGQRPILEIGQGLRRDPVVVVDQVALGDCIGREKHPVDMGQFDILSIDKHMLVHLPRASMASRRQVAPA